jgi:hypothetical protein
MGLATQYVIEYRRGDLQWEDLLGNLQHHPWQAPAETPLLERFQNADDMRNSSDTPEELAGLVIAGLLEPDEYAEIFEVMTGQVEKHAQHDQKDHGNWARANAAAERFQSEKFAQIRREADRISRGLPTGLHHNRPRDDAQVLMDLLAGSPNVETPLRRVGADPGPVGSTLAGQLLSFSARPAQVLLNRFGGEAVIEIAQPGQGLDLEAFSHIQGLDEFLLSGEFEVVGRDDDKVPPVVQIRRVIE